MWWIVAVAVIIGVGIGVTVLDRWPRSGDAGLADRPKQQPERHRPAVSPESTSIDPSAPRPTSAQLVAEARRVADRLLDFLPDNPQALTLAGRIHYAFGDEAAAAECWEECLEIDPEFAATWHVMGEAAWEQGDYEKAASQLRKAIAADARLRRKVKYPLADSLMSLGDPEAAVSVLEETTDGAPLTLDGLLLLGHAYLQLAEYQKGKDQFEAALAVDPRSSKAHFGLATVYARLGQPEQSRQFRREYVELKSQDLDETARLRESLRGEDYADVRPLVAMCCLNAGKIYALHGNVDEARSHWTRAAALDPRNSEPRTLLGLLDSHQPRREEAVRGPNAGNLGRRKPERK